MVLRAFNTHNLTSSSCLVVVSEVLSDHGALTHELKGIISPSNYDFVSAISFPSSDLSPGPSLESTTVLEHQRRHILWARSRPQWMQDGEGS